MKHKTRKKYRQGGYITLLSVLVVGAIGVSVAVSLILLGLGSSRNSFSLKQSNQAKALANACAEEALEEIQNLLVYEGSDTISLGQGSCEYTVTRLAAQNRNIVATGTVGDVVRKVEINIDLVRPQINIVLWQEVNDL
ncbi:MAG: hypothetical protein OEV93_05300 [Candidatus Moranbacteria bacterium]|nr:hypothetical protein [Candidatus Moranbacteria bacterium]